MRIRLKEFRRIIREVIVEAQDTRTIPAHLDPKEKELSAEFPKWGNQRNRAPQQTPAAVKAKQVAKILDREGMTNDPDVQKAVKQLQPRLEQMDPQELFLMDPSEIAKQLVNKIKG